MVDFEGIMLNEIKSDTERQILYDLTYKWDQKIKPWAPKYRKPNVLTRVGVSE